MPLDMVDLIRICNQDDLLIRIFSKHLEFSQCLFRCTRVGQKKGKQQHAVLTMSKHGHEKRKMGKTGA